MVCDAGRPRNERSPAMHGFLGSDGISPKEFLERSRAQLLPYENVSFIAASVRKIEKLGAGFRVSAEDGRQWRSKAVLLATGLIDKLPDIPGLQDCYGISVHSCPYCDAWEKRGDRLGVIGGDEAAINLALELLIWSNQVTLFTNTPPGTQPISIPAGRSLNVVEGEISILERNGAHLQFVVIDDRSYACDALFFSPLQSQHHDFAAKLGCHVAAGEIECGPEGGTGLSGLFIAGNASCGIQMAIVAAAEGLKAAAAINDWLIDYDFPRAAG